MKIFQKLHIYLLSLDTPDFYKKAGIFLAANTVIAGLCIYFFLSTMSTMKSSLQDIYKKELESNNLLDRLAKVKKQSEEINSILEQEPNFRIKNFYEDTLKKLNLESKQPREADVAEEEVLKGRYTEVRLTSQLKAIDTRQLCDLLQALEQKTRIYTKDLTIVKRDGLVDVTIIIGTLTSQLEQRK